MKYLIYGLQRSGTNFLEEILNKKYNIQVFNEENRKSILHKHFRLYSEKNKIPIPEYINNKYYESFIDLYDTIKKKINDEFKIIIIKKDIFSWLISIYKWSIKCNWTIKNRNIFLNDYYLFYKKWKQYYENNPDKILLITYIDLLNNDKLLIKQIKDFLNIKNVNNIDIIKKVNCSSIFNSNKKKYYINKEYMKFYSSNDIQYIKKFDI